MKQMKSFILGLVLLLAAGAMMSFTQPSDNAVAREFVVPQAIEEQVYEAAVEAGCLNQEEVQLLTENNAIQKCLNAYLKSGDPKAAIDEIAEIGVSTGRFQSKESVKATIKSTMETSRKKESNWIKLYQMLGL